METMKNIFFITLPLFSCLNSTKSQDGDIGNDGVQVNVGESTHTDTADDADPYFGNSDLPNILLEMDVDACDAISLEYPNTAGATSYFAGAYIKTDTRWRGREKWMLFPNEAWQNIAYEQWQEGNDELSDIAQGYPCEVTWDVLVTELSELENCLVCDFAFFVEATINPAITNCPQPLWDAPSSRTWQTNYEIASFDGNSIFYFQSSGDAFGWGYASEEELNFLSEASCKWF